MPNIVPLHEGKWRNGDKALRILNLGTRKRFMPWLLSAQGKIPLFSPNMGFGGPWS